MPANVGDVLEPVTFFFGLEGVECLHRGLKTRALKDRIELLQGTLDLLIMQTLQWGPQHGYGISEAMRTGSGDVLQVDTGSLYPALHRLEHRGWITAEWKVSENKQRTRVYQLTAGGKKQLAIERSRWTRMSAAIGAILSTRREREA
jgi:transcriptional regulator